MVDADFPRRAFIQTFDDVPRDYQCPSKILCPTLWPGSKQVVAIQHFGEVLSPVGGCYPQIPPKKPSKFSTVRPVVAELKRRGVEIQLRTTESVPLGGVKLGGFLGVTSDYPCFYPG